MLPSPELLHNTMGGGQSTTWLHDEQETVRPSLNKRRMAWKDILSYINSILPKRDICTPTLYTDLINSTNLEHHLSGFDKTVYTNAPLCLTQLYRMQMGECPTGRKCVAYLILYGFVMEKYLDSPAEDVCSNLCIQNRSRLPYSSWLESQNSPISNGSCALGWLNHLGKKKMERPSSLITSV